MIMVFEVASISTIYSIVLALCTAVCRTRVTVFNTRAMQFNSRAIKHCVTVSIGAIRRLGSGDAYRHKSTLSYPICW